MGFSRFSLMLLAAVCLASAGCRQEEAIEVNVVTHAEREPIRLRVAIMEHDPLVWFFRISGPESVVKDHVEAFDAFVRSVRFDDKKEPPITWTQPETWKKESPGALTFANFRIDAKSKQLEVTVTYTSAEKYSLMANMHRWQKQINRPVAELASDMDPFIKKEVVADQKVTWVDMQGLGVHTVSKPPPAPGVGGKQLLPGFAMERPLGASTPFKYTAPAGWIKRGPREMVRDSFEVSGDGDDMAEVTLSMLPGEGGGLGNNVNRWRGQVKLPSLPDDELRRSAKTIGIAGIDSLYVDVGNPKGPAGKNHILGVIIPHAGATWFVKMTGPFDWVSQNQTAFETFVKSFKLDAR